MDLIQLDTLQKTYKDFMEEMALNDNGSQERPLVYARAAWANAMRSNARIQDLGKVLGKHHATIVYYCKTHNAQMVYNDYRAIYEHALGIKSKYINDTPTEEMTIQRLSKRLMEKIEENVILTNKIKELELELKDKEVKLTRETSQMQKLKRSYDRLLDKKK
jgi:hypothetical protein